MDSPVGTGFQLRQERLFIVLTPNSPLLPQLAPLFLSCRSRLPTFSSWIALSALGLATPGTTLHPRILSVLTPYSLYTLPPNHTSISPVGPDRQRSVRGQPSGGWVQLRQERLFIPDFCLFSPPLLPPHLPQLAPLFLSCRSRQPTFCLWIALSALDLATQGTTLISPTPWSVSAGTSSLCYRSLWRSIISSRYKQYYVYTCISQEVTGNMLWTSSIQ